MKKLLLSTLLLASSFLGFGCQSKAAREQIAADTQTLLDRSLARCETGVSTPVGIAAYKKRLSAVFRDVMADDLQLLRKEGITICLDGRVNPDADRGYVEAVFYGAPFRGVLALPEDSNFTASVMGSFLSQLRDGNLRDAPMYARKANGRSFAFNWVGINDLSPETRAVMAPAATAPLRR